MLLAGERIDEATVLLALPAAGLDAPQKATAETCSSGTLAERVNAFERSAVLQEIQRQNRNITRAAAALGLERSHLYKKCQQLGIDLHDLPANGQNSSGM